ncbi:MAG: hypothetical protein WA705_08385 [Candidatus Ozemobacteraceae bacterium]
MNTSERGGIARAKTFVDTSRLKASDLFLVSCGSMFGAKVEKISDVSTDKSGLRTVKNVLLLETLLKGTWFEREPP